MKHLLLYILLATISFGQYSKITYTSTNYKLTTSDNTSLIVTSQTTANTTITVPQEKVKLTRFSTGTVIHGTALTDHTVTFVGEPGVTIVSYENSFRTKGYGSTWELRRLGLNTWVLSGELYSLEQTAFVGDDVVVKAVVDQTATGPFEYVWYKDGNIIPKATLASLKLFNVTTSDSGIYKAKVSNSKGEITSESTKLLIK